MNTLMIVLRWLHIVAGVYWVGAGLAMTFIIMPAVGATGDAGKQFVGHLMTKTKFSLSMSVAAVTTIAAGTAMYGFNSSIAGWAGSTTGMVFGIGGAFGFVALALGLMIPKTNGDIAKISAQIKGQPSADQLAALQSLRQRSMTISKVNAVCMIIATTLMATARFL